MSLVPVKHEPHERRSEDSYVRKHSRGFGSELKEDDEDRNDQLSASNTSRIAKRNASH